LEQNTTTSLPLNCLDDSPLEGACCSLSLSSSFSERSTVALSCSALSLSSLARRAEKARQRSDPRGAVFERILAQFQYPSITASLRLHCHWSFLFFLFPSFPVECACSSEIHPPISCSGLAGTKKLQGNASHGGLTCVPKIATSCIRPAGGPGDRTPTTLGLQMSYVDISTSKWRQKLQGRNRTSAR